MREFKIGFFLMVTAMTITFILLNATTGQLVLVTLLASFLFVVNLATGMSLLVIGGYSGWAFATVVRALWFMHTLNPPGV